MIARASIDFFALHGRPESAIQGNKTHPPEKQKLRKIVFN